MGETETTGVIVYRPAEGTRYAPRGNAIAFKAVGAQTDGAFSMMERVVPAGARKPPMHRHPGAELFYVLEGTLRFEVGEEAIDAGAGTSVLVVKGVAHTFGNASEQTATVLIIHAPAADGYFAELDAMWRSETTPTADEERALQRRYGWEPA